MIKNSKKATNTLIWDAGNMEYLAFLLDKLTFLDIVAINILEFKKSNNNNAISCYLWYKCNKLIDRYTGLADLSVFLYWNYKLIINSVYIDLSINR